MSSRPAIKAQTAVVIVLGASLAGCSDLYFARRDAISVVSGEAMAANTVTQTIDFWPPASGKRTIAYNGEKAAIASERYRTGKVIPPVNATTSSAAYAQAAQSAQSLSNSQSSSAPNK